MIDAPCVLHLAPSPQALIDPMYQYSLSYFSRLFNHCLDASETSPDLPTRLSNLLAFTTEFMFKTVCR